MQTCSETRFLEKHSMKVRLNQNWKTFYNVQKFMPAVPNPELLGGLLGNFCSSNRLIQLTDLVVVFYREIPSSCFSQCKANEEQFALKKNNKKHNKTLMPPCLLGSQGRTLTCQTGLFTMKYRSYNMNRGAARSALHIGRCYSMGNNKEAFPPASVY